MRHPCLRVAFALHSAVGRNDQATDRQGIEMMAQFRHNLHMIRLFLREMWVLARPYWVSEDRWAAWALLAVIVGLNLGSVYLNVVFNDWNNLFYNSLQNKDQDEFFHQMFRFCWLAVCKSGRLPVAA